MLINQYYKFKKLILLLFKARFFFKNPNKADIIIFDKVYSKNLKSIFFKKKNKLFFLESRPENISEIFLSKKILIHFIKNLFKYSLKINYFVCIINIIDPKIIITRIDTSKDFQILSKIFFNKIKCISFQQGDRTISLPGGVGKTGDTSIGVIKNYFIPYFFIFSDYDKEIFKKEKAKILNYKIAGSINSFLAKDYFKKKRIDIKKQEYDFCLISDSHKNSPCGIIAKYLNELCESQNKSYVIAADTNLKNNKELEFYRKHFFLKKKNIKKNNINSYSSYLTGLKSRVIIGSSSTLLREFIGFKKKVISINGMLEEIAALNIFTYKKEKNYIKWKPIFGAYKKFSDHSLRVLKMSTKNYFKLFRNHNYYMPRNFNTKDKFLKTIDEFL